MWKLPFLRDMSNRLIQIKERANIPLIIYVTWYRAEGHAEGRVEGHAEGRVEGINEGRLEEKREAASNMKTLNIPLDVISQVTGLSIEEIKAL